MQRQDTGKWRHSDEATLMVGKWIKPVHGGEVKSICMESVHHMIDWHHKNCRGGEGAVALQMCYAGVSVYDHRVLGSTELDALRVSDACLTCSKYKLQWERVDASIDRASYSGAMSHEYSFPCDAQFVDLLTRRCLIIVFQPFRPSPRFSTNHYLSQPTQPEMVRKMECSLPQLFSRGRHRFF